MSDPSKDQVNTNMSIGFILVQRSVDTGHYRDWTPLSHIKANLVKVESLFYAEDDRD